MVYRGPMQIEAGLGMCQVKDSWGQPEGNDGERLVTLNTSTTVAIAYLGT